MSQGTKPSLEATVLRGVPVADEPRMLLPQGHGRPMHPPAQGPGLLTSPLQDHTANEAKGEVGADPISSLEERSRGALDGAGAKGFREGFELGKQQGYEQGLLEGRERSLRESSLHTIAAKEALAERLERLDTWISGLSKAWSWHLHSRLSAVEEDMVSLSTSVALRILGERALDREAVRHGVQQAILQCREAGEGTLVTAIHVHPQDLEFLRTDPDLAEWFKDRDLPQVKWLADGGIRLGGCIIRSEHGALDARLETQFMELQKLLAQVRAERKPASDDPDSRVADS